MKARRWLLPALMALSAPAAAGKLDDFERKATHGPKDDKSVSASADESEGSFGEFIDLVGSVLVSGGKSSFDRAAGQGFEPRSGGEPAIPFVRADAGYQWTHSDVNAVDLRAELGFGPFAGEARHSRYTEKRPRDHMILTRFHALYRMTESRFFELDLGMGQSTLEGQERHSSVSFTTPLHFFAAEPFSLEFRPTWCWLAGVPLIEYDARVSYVRRGCSLYAGHRWLRSNDAHLDGPTVGFSLHF